MDSEGAVLLAAHKRMARGGAMQDKCDRLAQHGARGREWFSERLVASAAEMLLRRVWAAWRQEVTNNVASRAAAELAEADEKTRGAAAELEAEMMAASSVAAGKISPDLGGPSSPHLPSASPITVPKLPLPRSRRELYRTCIDDLIDDVLHLQELVYEVARVPMPPIDDEPPTPPGEEQQGQHEPESGEPEGGAPTAKGRVAGSPLVGSVPKPQARLPEGLG